MKPNNLFRILLRFQGRVQGVGFRYTCLALSESFAISGWVKNLADGTVELCAEGEQSELDEFLATIKETIAKSTYAVIESVNKEITEINQPEFESFSIVRD